jgi:hypothetical protein
VRARASQRPDRWSSSTAAAPFSAIITVGEAVLPEVMVVPTLHTLTVNAGEVCCGSPNLSRERGWTCSS